jgi:hypothetical protein
MQHTTLPGGDATCWTWDGGYLFRCEFALLQANRLRLHLGANQCNFGRYRGLIETCVAGLRQQYL